MEPKGIELPVNSVIIIALAIFVLLLMAAFFMTGSSGLDKTQVNTAFNQGCSQLSSLYSCDHEKMAEINTNLVVNGQAKNLLEVCRISFNNPIMSAFKCKNACGTCQRFVTEGSPCEELEDCLSPLTSEGWDCDNPSGAIGVCHNSKLAAQASMGDIQEG